MRPPADSIAVLFPGALGDFICFLPTLCALRERHAGQVLLVAKSELCRLVEIPGLASVSIERREIADLFVEESAPAPATDTLWSGFARVYSWTGCGNAGFLQRLAAVSGGDVSVYAFCSTRPGEHAVEYYARCVGVSPHPLTGAIRQDKDWLAAFAPPDQPVCVLHPGSGSPRKNWQGFDALARYWRERHAQTAVIFLSGPAEARARANTEGVIALEGLSLPQVAALLGVCDLYVGNDSGISHLAGAVGARGVVLFGTTDPTVWAPRGDRLQIIHAPAACAHCAPDAFCTHRLPVETVIHALEPRLAEA